MWERKCDCCGNRFGTPAAYEDHLKSCHAAPNSPLVEKVAVAMWNTWNRVMVEYGLHKQSNGDFFDPEPTDNPIKADAHRLLRRAALEEAQSALDACHAEEMIAILRRLAAPYAGPDSEPLETILKDADVLLSRFDESTEAA